MKIGGGLAKGEKCSIVMGILASLERAPDDKMKDFEDNANEASFLEDNRSCSLQGCPFEVAFVNMESHSRVPRQDPWADDQLTIPFALICILLLTG